MTVQYRSLVGCKKCGNAIFTTTPTAPLCENCAKCPPGCEGTRCHCQECGEPDVELNEDDTCAECVLKARLQG